MNGENMGRARCTRTVLVTVVVLTGLSLLGVGLWLALSVPQPVELGEGFTEFSETTVMYWTTHLLNQSRWRMTITAQCYDAAWDTDVVGCWFVPPAGTRWYGPALGSSPQAQGMSAQPTSTPMVLEPGKTVTVVVGLKAREASGRANGTAVVPYINLSYVAWGIRHTAVYVIRQSP